MAQASHSGHTGRQPQTGSVAITKYGPDPEGLTRRTSSRTPGWTATCSVICRPSPEAWTTITCDVTTVQQDLAQPGNSDCYNQQSAADDANGADDDAAGPS